MNIALTIAESSKETGALLRTMLESRGLTIDPISDIEICYGANSEWNSYPLNGRCQLDKMERLRLMTARGVPTVPWFEGAPDMGVPPGFQFPALARRSMGFGGTDIVPVFQADEVAWRLLAGWDWFSSYVPLKTEGRVWVFQDEILDCYEKVMERPADYKHIGRNFRNGFEFKPWPDCPGSLREAAADAVNAIGLDFAAVDIILGRDMKPYVLEANTAPGVLRSHAESTLEKLADRMVDWVKSVP